MLSPSPASMASLLDFICLVSKLVRHEPRPAAPRARAAASQRESLVPAQHERGLEAGQLVAALEAGPPRLPELARAQAEVEEETPKAVVPPLEAAAWADMPALSGVVRGKSAAALEA